MFPGAALSIVGLALVFKILRKVSKSSSCIPILGCFLVFQEKLKKLIFDLVERGF